MNKEHQAHLEAFKDVEASAIVSNLDRETIIHIADDLELNINGATLDIAKRLIRWAINKGNKED